MKDEQLDDFHILVLAGLLHDIGKALFPYEVLPDNFQRIKDRHVGGHKHAKWSANFIYRHREKFGNIDNLIDLVLYHGRPNTVNNWQNNKRNDKNIYAAKLIYIADSVSSIERKTGYKYESDDKENQTKDNENQTKKLERSQIPLLSVFNEVNLGLKSKTENPKAYSQFKLEIDKNFTPNLESPRDVLDKNFYMLVSMCLNCCFKQIIKMDDEITIYHILHKLISTQPSATPKAKGSFKPDISLFDHARTTSAVISCLAKLNDNNVVTLFEELYHYKNKEDNNQQTVNQLFFIILNCNMFGIQDFVYTPSNVPGTSKRLRGRSFYVSLLTDIIARYIVYELELSYVNILYCSSGEFQILLPNTEECKNRLCNNKYNNKEEGILNKINKKIFELSNGKLGFVFADTEVSPLDFTNWDDVLKRADNKMNALKKQKLKNLLQQDKKSKSILLLEEKNKDICKSCGNTISYSKEENTMSYSKEEDEECDLCKMCKMFEQIGEKLPYTKAIILHQGNGKISENNKEIDLYKIDCKTFGKAYLVVDYNKNKTIPSFKINGEIKHLEYYTLNSTDNFINAATFENASASYGFKFIGNAVARNEKGEVLEFEKIADSSKGAKKLGILKLDVDLTKLMFQIGLSAEQESDRTISRIATLSRMLELFFSGYINTICNEEEFKDKVYIVYSGGDDLFIVGPWSLIPKLAQKIYDDFKKYTCNNEDISLSGGIFICDAKFPVKRFAYLVNDELRKSKENGRDRITMFGETVPWTKNTNGKISFKELMEFSNKLTEYLDNKKISRGFLHHLLRINKLCVEGSYQYFPYLVWQITRNIKDKDVKKELYEKFITNTKGKDWVANLKIPICYALLKSRR